MQGKGRQRARNRVKEEERDILEHRIRQDEKYLSPDRVLAEDFVSAHETYISRVLTHHLNRLTPLFNHHFLVDTSMHHPDIYHYCVFPAIDCVITHILLYTRAIYETFNHTFYFMDHTSANR